MPRGTISVVAVTLALLATSVVGAGAEETRVTVSVLSQGAKFIGTGIGGAMVTIRSVDTGEILARGLTEGSGGDTDLLMKQNITRGTTLVDEESAKFMAAIDIEVPMQVEITARAPMAQRQARAEASITQWLIPGRHVATGNAVLLEIPGFVVDVLSPPAHVKLQEPVDVPVRVNLTMM
jgi:hypothetical protein